MIIHISIPRDILKSILAQLLSEYSPRTRLELYAQDCGYRTDAALTAATAEKETSHADLCKAAANGKVLPLLVSVAYKTVQATNNPRTTARPKALPAGMILRNSMSEINWEVYRNNLGDVLLTAKQVHKGPSRWFYAVATSHALFNTDKTYDRFWHNKANRLLCSFLSLVEHIKSSSFSTELNEDLLKIDPANLSDWEKEGYAFLEPQVPSKTYDSIYSTMIDGLPRLSKAVLNYSNDDFDSGIRPGQSW